MKDIVVSAAGTADQLRQEQLLPGVSRTFALTIPQLPEPLREVVTNAYLLCRIADTIEDDAALTPLQKADFHEQFRAVVAGQACAGIFAQTLLPLLSPETPSAEREFVQHIPAVIRCLRNFTPQRQDSLHRCVNIMSTGMPEFQRTVSLNGLENQAEMDRYCYYVAGVVGEMLTELFCEYSNRNRPPAPAAHVSGGFLWPGTPNDEYPERLLGGPPARRVLAAPRCFSASRPGFTDL